MNYLEYFFFTIAIGMFVLGIIANYGETFIPSSILQIFRYGRANKSESKARLIRTIEVPKSWFAHFYLYAVLLQISILYTLLTVYTSASPARKAQESYLAQILTLIGGQDRPQTVDATTTLVGSALFTFQVTRRLYECFFVSVYSGTKMNLLHYFLAFAHYSGSAFSVVAHSVGFTGSQMVSSQSDFVTTSSCEWKLCYKRLNLFHIIAIFIFLYGSYEQNKAHKQYADLRKGKKNEVVSFAHRMPQGGLFDKVSCPNYWAEIIIYSSFCILFQGANPTWNCVFLWVASNQIMAGVMNHKWCQKAFPDYPKNRKAVVPYVW